MYQTKWKAIARNQHGTRKCFVLETYYLKFHPHCYEVVDPLRALMSNSLLLMDGRTSTSIRRWSEPNQYTLCYIWIFSWNDGDNECQLRSRIWSILAPTERRRNSGVCVKDNVWDEALILSSNARITAGILACRMQTIYPFRKYFIVCVHRRPRKGL